MWYRSPSFVFHLFARISVGLCLLILGVALYRNFPPFYANATDGLGGLRFIGMIWAHILPALFAFAGGMLLVGRYSFVTAWVGGAALGSVPVGMMLKHFMTEVPLEEVLVFIFPLFIWMLLFKEGLLAPPVEIAEEESEAV